MGLLQDMFAKIFRQKTPAAAATTSNTASQSGMGSSTPAASPVDIDQVLTQMASQQGEKLNWKTSIVDLMKVVGMDSSLSARKELAKELNYSGDMNNSAEMNMWLHKQVVQKMAQNGGKVPQELLA